MPGRLMQLCYCFVGPPQIPDVAEPITFVGEVMSRELMKLWKREQVETDEEEDERNDNQFYRFCRTGLLCHFRFTAEDRVRVADGSIKPGAQAPGILEKFKV